MEQYNLEGTIDINKNRKHEAYRKTDTWSTYQEDFIKFKHNIIEWSEKNEPKVLLRVYDGELLFMKNTKRGNVGRRHVSVELTPEFTKSFYENSLKCDKLASHLTVIPPLNYGKVNSQFDLYTEIYGRKKIDYPMEFHYAIVLNRWIFKNFKNQIGLIGGKGKIGVIRKLMEYKEYRDYLGIDCFTNYIEIPEKFSCDNPPELLQQIKKQLRKSNPSTKIFLFGMGISKLAAAYKFKNYFPAIYIDAGGSFSALAGFISKRRPYAAGWTNYRIQNYDYSNVDKMDTTEDENIIYL